MRGIQRCVFLSSCLILLLQVPLGTAAADVVRVPLTLSEDTVYLRDDPAELLGFETGATWLDIVDVRLHVTGLFCCHLELISYTMGPISDANCYDPGFRCGFLVDETEVYPTVQMLPGIYDNSPTYAICTEQTYDLEIPFDTGGESADWSFLAEGRGTVYLRGLEDPQTCYYPLTCYYDPSASVTSAELVVELEPRVSDQVQTWGTIKALYR